MGRILSMQLKTVFFDFDGLIADTEEFHLMAYEMVGNHIGIPLTRDYICSFIGASTRSNVRDIMDKFDIPDDRFDELLGLRYASYLEILKNTPIPVMSGAVELIEHTRSSGLQSMLVTSSLEEHARAGLDNITRYHGLDTPLSGMFTGMIFGNEIEKLKPEPDIYLEALRRSNTPPEGGMVLEDSRFGVEAAKRAGLFVIAVPGAHTLDQDLSEADIVVSSLLEVLELDFFRA